MKDKMSHTEKHQQDHRTPCLNPGNPVFSCMLQSSASSGPKPQDLLYRTTSSKYGSLPPTFESSPCVYHPVSQAFSKHMGKCGMYRDTTFNTILDRSRVYDCPNLHHTI
ncbi:piercer of microtubule wall 2 protein [Tachysurus vachellii]|nr:piercer of microtubule wall 2 protein [Tachysurus vachellii]